MAAAMLCVLLASGIGCLLLTSDLHPGRSALLIATLILSSFMAVKRWKARNPSTLIYAAFALLFGVVPVAAALYGTPENYPPDTVLLADFAVLLTLLCLFAGEEAFHRSRFGNEQRPVRRSAWTAPLPDSVAAIAQNVSLILCVAGYIYYYFVSAPMSVADMLRTNRMELRLEHWGALWLLACALQLLGCVALAIALFRGGQRFCIAMVVLVSLGVEMITGARTSILLFGGPLLYHYLVRKQLSVQRVIAIMAVGCVSVVFLFGVLHIHRWQSQRDFQSLIATTLNRETYDFLLTSSSSDLNVRQALYSAVELYPRYNDFLWLNTYKTMALFWIPSRLLPGKVDTMYKFALAQTGDYKAYFQRGSAHPTLVGELYLNFGYFFWAGAFLWGWVFGWVQRSISRCPGSPLEIILAASWCYFILIAFRGSVYQPFMVIAYLTFMIWPVIWVSMIALTFSHVRVSGKGRVPTFSGQAKA